MDEIMKNDLTSKIYFLEKDEEKRKKMEVNALVNAELIEVIRQIFRYYIENKLNERNDLIELRQILNFIMKTGKSKYDAEKKFERLGGLIGRLGKKQS